MQHLAQEYLLVPAWKKSHDYIRYHNWYSDVLELDLTNADLENRIQALRDEIACDEPLHSDPLRLVLAPKSQEWNLKKGQWAPVDGPASVEQRLRPLAHVSVRDQILATAFAMLFADIIETRQGDPRLSVQDARNANVVSYGNRLFCDAEADGLRFRWGNSSVYRQYFEDYQAFVARPQLVVQEEFPEDSNWAIVNADLSQFYDRVRPEALFEKLKSLVGEVAEEAVLQRFKEFFRWQWHKSDCEDALKYSETSEPPIEGFSDIALPQGLVVAGFFANAFLIDFDEAVIAKRNKWAGTKEWQLVDYCRYVDDMRIVVRLGESLADATDKDIAESVTNRLARLLEETTRGLELNPAKSTAVLGRDTAGGVLPVSKTIQRINHNTSGAMDIFTGEETIDLIERLFFSQEEEPLDFADDFRDTFFTAKPDVRDETVARFAANRFRRTYRSLRPLCEDEQTPTDGSLLPTLSRESLDGRAAYFSRRLIERWVKDPSNMRLLRIALDVFPDIDYLNVVLDLLKQYVTVGSGRKAPRRVAWYCTAELLKAGATETGLVNDGDCLPHGIDLTAYQEKLVEVAEIIAGRYNTYPWYLEQQAYLYLACMRRPVQRQLRSSTPNHLKNYIRLHSLLGGQTGTLRRDDIVPYSILQANLFGKESAATAFLSLFREAGAPTQRKWLLGILREMPELAREVYDAMLPDEQVTYYQLFVVHGAMGIEAIPGSLLETEGNAGAYSLLAVSQHDANPFQQEYAALHFARLVLSQLSPDHDLISPHWIRVAAQNWRCLCGDRFPIHEGAFSVDFHSPGEVDGRYSLPDWISSKRAWAYQLGQVLRVLLTGKPDFTEHAWWRLRRQRPESYQPYRSSWLRRRYGLFNGRSAFGAPWLPATSWLGELIGRLLEWPGVARFNSEIDLPEDFSKTQLSEAISLRISELERLYGQASSTPVLPVRVPRKKRSKGQLLRSRRTMRMGVVQTAIPKHSQIMADPELSDAAMRVRHRRHLSAVLGGVHRLLQVRETHAENHGGIEMLILPELSVHMDDVNTHLVPFAKQHHCIVFAGVVFHSRGGNTGSLINSGLWIVPFQTPQGSLHVDFIEQGKLHRTKEERDLGIVPFRPAQWILEFVSSNTKKRLWAVTGSICYDSTDLKIAADLRDKTDMLVIPALNPDVGTFDNMVAALHYHMFQHVIIANSGEYGGSTGQAPFSDRHRRPIFHTHGNEQATISFFEVDLRSYREGAASMKTPPAGFRGRER